MQKTLSPARVARLYHQKKASRCTLFTGGDRLPYLDAVWEMFVETYTPVGLKLSVPQELLSYPVWDLCFDAGEPVTFNVFKKTEYGLKSGLSGHNGSAAGRRGAVEILRTKFKQPGFYGEVSHKVEQIVLAAGTPVVCNAYVGQILKKRVHPLGDSLHYERQITGVGVVKKILVGNPRGIPSTVFSSPVCPIGPSRVAYEITADDQQDVLAHMACLALTGI